MIDTFGLNSLFCFAVKQIPRKKNLKYDKDDRFYICKNYQASVLVIIHIEYSIFSVH